MIKRGKRGVKIRQVSRVEETNRILLNKRGQFYLVAAVIIAVVIFSLATISNYAKPKERTTMVFELGSMINFEAGKTVAYAQMNKEDTWKVVGDFVGMVMNSSSQNLESWFIVYGDPNNMTVMTFANKDAGEIKIDTGAPTSTGLIITQRVVNKSSINYGGVVNVTFYNITYKFDMNSGNNFAFLIKEENYVSSSSGTLAIDSNSPCVLSGNACRATCYSTEVETGEDCSSSSSKCCKVS